MEVSPKLFERLTEIKEWTPYIKSTILVFSPRAKGKYEMAFKESNFTSIMLFDRARKLLKPQ